MYLPEQLYRDIYETYIPRLCVDLVLRHEGKVLLVKRTKAPIGWWHLPGGTIYKNEKIEEAARRIASTDLGITELPTCEISGVVEFLHCPQEIGGDSIDMHNIMIEVQSSVSTKLVKSAEEVVWTSHVPAGPRDEMQMAFLVRRGLLR